MENQHNRSSQKLIELSSADQCSLIRDQRVSSLTVLKAKDSDQLSLIRKNNPKEAVKLMGNIVLSVCEYYKSEITSMDCVNYAEQILNNFWFMKIDDILLCFNRGVNGYYGKVYRMDYGTLVEWLTSYDLEKVDLARDEVGKYKEPYNPEGRNSDQENERRAFSQAKTWYKNKQDIEGR